MDPKGKIVVITGATSGLGQAAAVDFAAKGAKVIIVGRDKARADETLAQVRAKGGDADVILGDVSTAAGARALGQAILAKTDRIDVLINNAGGTFDKKLTTSEGFEMTFALNVLGAYVLEHEVHRALVAAKGRVVNLATGFLDSFPVVPDELTSGPKKYKGLAAYGRAKQAAVMMTVEQSARFASEGVSVVSMHPGVIMGTRFGGGQPAFVVAVGGPIMRAVGFATTLEGAVERFHAAAFGDVPSGSYMMKGKPAPLPKQVNDAAVRGRVMGILDGLTSSKRAAA